MPVKIVEIYDNNGKKIGETREGKEDPDDYPDPSPGYSSGGSGSSGSGAWYIGTVIAVILGIILVILFVRAFILGGDGDWSTMMTMLKVTWFIIKLPFLIVWTIVRVAIWILDKITTFGFLIIAIISFAIGAIIIFRRKG